MQQQAAAVLPTQNSGWGFWGTLAAQLGSREADHAWGYASRHLLAACEGVDAESVRAFLDSKHGRHFADDVFNAYGPGGAHHLDQAVNMATSKWKAWRVSARTARTNDMPADVARLGYLKAFVILAGIEAAAA